MPDHKTQVCDVAVLIVRVVSLLEPRQDYFSFWVFISIAWSFVAAFVIIVLPIQESMDSILGVCCWMFGKGAPKEEMTAEPTSEPTSADL